MSNRYFKLEREISGTLKRRSSSKIKRCKYRLST